MTDEELILRLRQMDPPIRKAVVACVLAYIEQLRKESDERVSPEER